MELTKDNLVRGIIAHKGSIISEGTLKTEHLLVTFYDLFKEYHLSPEIQDEISKFFDEEPTYRNLFYNNCHLFPEKEEEATEYLNDTIMDFLNYDVAPTGYYFGSSEGDGACIGFFLANDEEEV